MIHFELCLFVEIVSLPVYLKWKPDSHRLYCSKIWCVSQVCSCIKSMPCVVYCIRLHAQVFINIKIHHIYRNCSIVGCTQNLRIKFRQDVCQLG